MALKKIASFILICILLFNWFGYRFVVVYMQQRADTQLESRLDYNQYDEAQLVEIKIPINLPYPGYHSEFERFYGEIELNGVLYKYVKRKLVNDTLFLMCIPNLQKMNLQTAGTDFFKMANDLVQTNHSKKSEQSKTPNFKNPLSEYAQYGFTINMPGYSGIQNNYGIPQQVNNLFSTLHNSPEQPPDNI